MSQENVDLMRSTYDAFAQGAIPKVIEAMHPEIVWCEADNFPYADGNPYRGPQAVLDGVFRRLGEEWEYFTLAIEDFFDAGDNVIVTGRYNAAYRKTGAIISAQFAHIWWIENGKIKKFQQYTDTAQVAEAVEGARV